MTRLCTECGYDREVGVEIGSRGVPHCNECSRRLAKAGGRRRYYAKRGIADDERLCERCGYPFKRQRSRLCQDCRTARDQAYGRVYRATHREEFVEYTRTYRERIFSDPYLAEQYRKASRERAAKYRAADPEHYREIERRVYAKRRADPKRWRKWLDEANERTRARKLARGEPIRVLTPKVYNQRNGESIYRRLPIEPLMFNMREYLNGDERTMKNLADAAGVPLRRVQGILNGEFRNVTVTTADRLCVGLEVPLSLVYPEAS